MKKFASLIAIFGMTYVLSSVTPAHATFLGDYCWLVSDGQTDFSIFKLGVTDVQNPRQRRQSQFNFTDLQEGSHLSINGIEVESDGTPNPDGEIVYGSAYVVGSELIVILNSTYNDTENMGIATFYVRLPLASLSGTYTVMGTVLDKQSGIISTVDYSDLFTLIPCP